MSCAIVARFGANITYTVTLHWAAEMLTTPLRGSGTSAIQICGYEGIVISPYFIHIFKSLCC